MILIDTSAWIEFLKRRGDRVTKHRVAGLIDAGEAAYSDPILFELLRGAREEEIADVREALGFSSRLEFTQEAWELAAKMEKGLRRQGVAVPRDDVFVAAASVLYHAPVFARDRHFEIIRESVRPRLEILSGDIDVA